MIGRYPIQRPKYSSIAWSAWTIRVLRSQIHRRLDRRRPLSRLESCEKATSFIAIKSNLKFHRPTGKIISIVNLIMTHLSSAPAGVKHVHYTSPTTMIVVATISLSLATLAVLLRFFARTLTRSRYCTDDWLVLAALVRIDQSNFGTPECALLKFAKKVFLRS